jgi:hypothetical protein
MKELSAFSATDFLIPASDATLAIKSAFVITFTSPQDLANRSGTVKLYQYGGAGN